MKQPVDNLILSNSLRAAVTGLSKTLSNEVAEFGVTVNNILPGYTSTERVEQLARSISENEGISVDEAKKRWESQIPMKRLGGPDEFAALAAFLGFRTSQLCHRQFDRSRRWLDPFVALESENEVHRR